MPNSNVSKPAAADRSRLAELLRARTAGGSQAQPVIAAIQRQKRDTPLPTSFAQRRLWFFDQLTPGTGVYNIHAGIRILGPLDVARLQQALSAIVARHEVLRTRFVDVDGEPRQVIEPATVVEVPIDVVRGVDRDAEVRRLADEETRRPFDLSSGCLLRARLLRLAPEVHVLLTTMHHIASDGTSAALVMQELQAYYGGNARALPDLPVQYGDFAAWQREQAASDVAIERQLDYWRDGLADAPVLDLPTDFPRPAVQSFRGGTSIVLIERPVMDGVKQLALAHGTTTFAVMLAAFQVLVSRLSGQDDVTVGTPVSGRSRPELERLIGCFINTLPIRLRLDGAPSFAEVVRRTRAAMLSAFANQDVPFDRIVEELNPVRDRGRSPFFQVLFNMLAADGAWRGRMGELTIEPMPPTDEASKFDLTVYVGETADAWYLRTVYNADLFSAPRIASMIEQYRQLLAAVIADPAKPIGSYSLVTPSAAPNLPDPVASLPSRWTGSALDRLQIVATREPQRPAIEYGNETWSYAQLAARSNAMAARLASRCVAGGVVAVYARRTPQLVATLLAAWKAGAAFCVLDARYPVARLAACLRAAAPRALVSIGAVAPEELRRLVPADAYISADTVDALEDFAAVDVDPDAAAYLAFTSGSTGVPKGIVGTQRPVSHFIDWHVSTFNLASSDRFSMLSGLAHDPLIRDVMTPLWVGASLHIPLERDLDSGEQLAEWLCRSGITVAHLTPPMAHLIGQARGSAAGRSALRYAFFGGDRLGSQHVAAIRRLSPTAQCINFYGATETPQAVGAFIPASHGQPPVDGAWPIGAGIEGVQLLVVNGSRGLAGVGELGEICVRTPYLTRGYLEADERGAFTANPFTGAADDRVYCTNDLGRYRPDGLVELCGRNDTQVKIRGFRVELGDIETVLASHPDVRQAVVTCEPTGGSALVAYVVARGELDPSALRSFIQVRVPDYMVPSVFVPLASVPLTPNGKLDRRKLPAPDVAACRTVAAVEPATPIEAAVAAIWAELLKVPRVGATDNFFDLGGHSLLATQLVSRMRQQFDVELALRTIFDAPTVRALSEAVTRALAGSDEELAALLADVAEEAGDRR